MRTFLKWAGNKQRIVGRIKELLPGGSRLFEPFVGSGAVFLNTDYQQYVLADSNPDLIALYQQVQSEGQPFIDYCRGFFVPGNNAPDAYYSYRLRFNQSPPTWEKAALFLYLNRHGYNGLCRYNSRGLFNVPFGRYKRPYFPEREMTAFHKKSQSARFVIGDFQEVLEKVGPGDVAYCDPPYVPLSVTAHFTRYSARAFDKAEQTRLAQAAEAARSRGATVVISNHATDFTRKIYKDAADIRTFTVQRFISAKARQRGKVKELLAVYTPEPA